MRIQGSGFGLQEENNKKTDLTKDVTLKEPALPESRTPNPETSKKHPDPTRYGDWEIAGKCVDF